MKTKISINFGLILVSFLILFSVRASADIDNSGKEFFLSYLPNIIVPNTEVHLTSSVITDVTIEYPINSPTFTTTVTVSPDNITIVDLPLEAAQNWNPDSIHNNSFRLSSTQEFVAYTVNRMDFSSDAALALPIDALGSEYVISTYQESAANAEASVTAVYDNTTITITPSVTLTSGQTAGVTFNKVLNRGEAYFFAANSQAAGLTGTIVSSDKPVSVINGNSCANVPVNVGYCDHIYEQAHPVSTWGKKLLAVNLFDRPSGSVYRIISSTNNNQIKLDGVDLVILSKGQYYELGPIADTHIIEGDAPIFVTQYMTGNSSAGATLGDPAMGNLIPSDQFLGSYTFSTVSVPQFELHVLTIIANDLDVGTLSLDGIPLPTNTFTSIPNTGYSYALVPLLEGTHKTSSVHGHGIFVAGYGNFDSYLYAGGARFALINPEGDLNPPICSINLIPGQPGKFSGTAIDNRPTEDLNLNGVIDSGEDLNSNGQIDKDKGIYLVELLSGSSNLILNPVSFIPGDGTVNFSLEAINPNIPALGVIRASDGAGNICEAVISETICESTDLKPQLVIMDGNGQSSYKLGSSIKKSISNYSANKLSGNSLLSQLNALHLANWTITWTKLPHKVINNCNTTTLCTQVDSVSSLNIFNTNAKKMFLINKSLIQKLKKAGAPARLINKYSAQNAKIYKQSQVASSNIPKSTLSCN